MSSRAEQILVACEAAIAGAGITVYRHLVRALTREEIPAAGVIELRRGPVLSDRDTIHASQSETFELDVIAHVRAEQWETAADALLQSANAALFDSATVIDLSFGTIWRASIEPIASSADVTAAQMIARYRCQLPLSAQLTL